MARTQLTVVNGTSLGISVGSGVDVAGDSANGNEFINDGVTFLLVRNTDVSPRSITFKGPFAVDGTSVTDVVVSISASTSKFFGPFPVRIFNGGNQASGSDAGFVNMDISNALLFLQAIRVPAV